MYLLLTNELQDDIVRAVTKNKYFLKSSGGDISHLNMQINSANVEEAFSVFRNKKYEAIFIDSTVTTDLDVIDMFRDYTDAQLIMINKNNDFKLKDLYYADIFNIIDYKLDFEKFRYELFDSALKHYDDESKIRFVSDILEKEDKNYIVFNSRIVEYKWFSKYTEKKEIHLIDGYTTKLDLFKELAISEDKVVFIDGSLRMAEVLYAFNLNHEYYDSKERDTDIFVTRIRNKGKDKRFLKKQFKQYLKTNS